MGWAMMKDLVRQMMFSVAAIGLVAVLGGRADAGTITFDTQPTGTFSSFTEAGFTVTAIPGNPGDTSTIQNVGGTNQNVLVDGNPNDVFGTLTEITQTGGGLFSLVSLDVGNLDNPGSPIPVSPGSGFRIEVSGVPGGDDVYGPGSSTFVTESPTDLTNLSALFVNLVSFSGGQTFAVDNIVLTSVPEPASMALLCAGLLGFGLIGRRKFG